MAPSALSLDLLQSAYTAVFPECEVTTEWVISSGGVDVSILAASCFHVPAA